MPTVGKGKSAKHFPYTEKGMKQAMDEAHKTGKPMTKKKMPMKGMKGMKK